MHASLFRSLVFLGVGAILLSSCSATTSGSQRLDETGNRMAEQGIVNPLDDSETPPAGTTQLLSALKGGIIGRMAGLQLSPSDHTRALEAEYKALELSPAGQTVAWNGDRASGQIMAAAPYQVGEQNCRQYSHTLTTNAGKSFVARGAACRNRDGSWSPLD